MAKKAPSNTKKKSTVEETSDTAAISIEDTNHALKELSELDREKHTPRFFLLLIASVAIISSLISIGIAQQFRPTLENRTTLAAKLSGGVCLSEKELRNVVAQRKLTAYWAGPLSDAMYSINASQNGQVFVRYVKKGQNCDSENADFRVIATYSQAGAFESTKAAGSQANGVSLANADGSIVYFSKNTPTNVYLAYPGIDFQIEIYDPNPKDAVTIATTANSIQLIKG